MWRRYSELLREIRKGRIKDVLFFDHEHTLLDETEYTPVEGPCLVVYQDGHVAQAYIPPYDVRIQCAFELCSPLSCARLCS